MIKNIGFAITGSFCTHQKILEIIKDLVDKGYNIIPIFSEKVSTTDTRFGTAKDFKDKIINLTNRHPIESIVDAEPLGPKGMIDVLVVAPCTGNTLAKLANAIIDNAVTMATKAHLRNNKPVVIGLSSNDALGLNLKNIATLIVTKNVYFVPFGQDNPEKKPKSLIADYNQIEKTMLEAIAEKQIQPILLKN
ncbi:MAG: dipicolinate synthase subunit B [Clostridia bacterium]|nr:dipicolinate synthase subunit B [Clostridia bacterium]